MKMIIRPCFFRNFRTRLRLPAAMTILTMLCLPQHTKAIPVELFSQFTDNIQSQNFSISPEETLTGELSSPGFVFILAAVIVLALAESLGDPQHAVLISEFEVEGTNRLPELINHATLPENVVFTRHLPDFLGGSTFIGSSAYSGTPRNSLGEVTPDVTVGFGVFQTDAGASLLTPISFAPTAEALLGIQTVHWEFSPALSDDEAGRFRASIRHLVAIEPPPIPEPGTGLLLALGLGGIAMIARKSRKGQRSGRL